MAILVVFMACQQKKERLIDKVTMPNINENYTILIDNDTKKKSVLTEQNHMKQYNDMDVGIDKIDSGDMIVSIVLNFTRALSDDKFGILQPDKIFSNLVDFKYLELPLSHSKTSLALLEILGDGQAASMKKKLNKDKKSFQIYYKPKRESENSKNSLDENLPIDPESEKVSELENVKSCKKGKLVTIKGSDGYHDRSMASMFAKNESKLTGFTHIQNIKNLKFRYVQTCEDRNKADSYPETFSFIKETISSELKNNTDIVSMSIKLFDNESQVYNFLNSKSNSKDIENFSSCILGNNCKNDKFIWAISLGNLDNRTDKNNSNMIESTKRYCDFQHTKFITTVTGVVNDTNNSIIFTQQGQQFKFAKKNDIDYFSINLPKKTLFAYTKNELKFQKASTSYATAIFSAIVYNLYSLNPSLDEKSVTNILKDTAYNRQCEENLGNSSVKYDIGGNKENPYDINCATHRPSRVGYIVNMKKAYKKAVRQLIETHNYFFFTEGDIAMSLYRDDSIIEKTRVLDENRFLVKRIKIIDKNFDNMNLGEASIVDNNMTIDFSKDKIICRYTQKFDAFDGSYSDITHKEVTLKYKEDGQPFISEERNLFSK